VKQAKIKCPCCGTEIIVRQKEDEARSAAIKAVFADMDRHMAELDAALRKAFRKPFWRRL
jgi:uncharacterized Zn finger protein (UPF0148 family)